MSFLKRISYEEELSKVKLNESLKKYYQERPEKKEELLKKLNSLKEKIVNDEEIGNFYKKSFLSSIEKNIEILNDKESNRILEIGFPFLTFLLGFFTRGKFESFFQNYNREIASDINKIIEEEFRRSYENR